MRLAEWRGRLVRPRDNAPARRRPGDAVRMVVAATALVFFSLHSGDPTGLEREIIRFANRLPGGASSFFAFLYNLLTLWAVGLLAVAALLVRRWRLARDLAIAGAAAWIAGRLLAFLVQGTDLWETLRVTLDLTDAPRYPATRLAVATAMVVVAGPHLTRPVRRVGQTLVALIGLGALYVGRAAPNDLLAAIVLGWGTAAAVRYAFGTPDGRPTAADAAQALAKLGLPGLELTAAPEQPKGRAIFYGRDRDGLLRVSALGRDEADAQLLARLRRFVLFKDAPSTLLLTRRQQVEHEAYIELLAAGAAARVPVVERAGNVGALAVLVERIPEGTRLFETPKELVTDATLADAWRQVQALRSARIAHGKLDGHALVVDGGSAAIVEFESSSAGSADQALTADVAQLLAATAATVGPERAVDAAVRGVGATAVASALPMLQPQAISGWTHDAFGGRNELDDRLRELREVGARAVGVDPPQLRSLFRVHPRSLIMAVAALLAVGFLLSRIGDPAEFWEQIRNANWGYVALAFLLGVLTDAAFGITFLGTVPIRLRVWPCIELQSAMSFSNLAVPVAADSAMQVRFLQKQGMDLPSAVATGGLLSSVSEIVVQIALFFVAIWLAPDSLDFGRVDTGRIAAVAAMIVFVVGVAAAVVFGIRRLRRRVLPPVAQAARTVWSAVRTPGRLALLVGGNVIAQCLYAGSLLACLYAFGARVDFFTLLALNIGISTIASLVPLPGGGTAVSAVGMAGMLTAFGVPEATTAAAVLAHQLAVSYLPAIPGWFATNDLIKKGLL